VSCARSDLCGGRPANGCPYRDCKSERYTFVRSDAASGRAARRDGHTGLDLGRARNRNRRRRRAARAALLSPAVPAKAVGQRPAFARDRSASQSGRRRRRLRRGRFPCGDSTAGTTFSYATAIPRGTYSAAYSAAATAFQATVGGAGGQLYPVGMARTSQGTLTFAVTVK
jgi:hypothetical protein